MRRILTVAAVALVMAALMVASVMPAFAQGKGPEGGNPGIGICKVQQEETAGESEQRPLPFGGQEPAPALENAPQGVVVASPGSPFSASNPQVCPEPEA